MCGIGIQMMHVFVIGPAIIAAAYYELYHLLVFIGGAAIVTHVALALLSMVSSKPSVSASKLSSRPAAPVSPFASDQPREPARIPSCSMGCSGTRTGR